MKAALAWDEPLPTAERDRLLDEAARAVVARGLATPAIFFLEMHKPLAFVASQGLVGIGPLFAPLIGLERMQRLTRLLAEPGAAEALIGRIEERAAGGSG